MHSNYTFSLVIRFSFFIIETQLFKCPVVISELLSMLQIKQWHLFLFPRRHWFKHHQRFYLTYPTWFIEKMYRTSLYTLSKSHTVLIMGAKIILLNLSKQLFKWNQPSPNILYDKVKVAVRHKTSNWEFWESWSVDIYSTQYYHKWQRKPGINVKTALP